MIVVEQPNEEKVILQQPILHEHSLILKRLCDEADIDISSIYITPIIKCECKPKSKDYKTCITYNLKSESNELNPYTTLVCGSIVSKWYKKLGQTEFIELPSLTALLGNKTGRDRLVNIFRTLNRE